MPTQIRGLPSATLFRRNEDYRHMHRTATGLIFLRSRESYACAHDV